VPRPVPARPAADRETATSPRAALAIRACWIPSAEPHPGPNNDWPSHETKNAGTTWAAGCAWRSNSRKARRSRRRTRCDSPVRMVRRPRRAVCRFAVPPSSSVRGAVSSAWTRSRRCFLWTILSFSSRKLRREQGVSSCRSMHDIITSEHAAADLRLSAHAAGVEGTGVSP